VFVMLDVGDRHVINNDVKIILERITSSGVELTLEFPGMSEVEVRNLQISLTAGDLIPDVVSLRKGYGRSIQINYHGWVSIREWGIAFILQELERGGKKAAFLITTG